MYRHDPARSGRSAARIADALTPRWRTPIISGSDADPGNEWRLRSGYRITPPVVAGGIVYVCDVQGYQVVAIDDETGQVNWRFTAGGRIDSPPTIFKGRCLFGCRDGYVYCLGAGDGRLLWRYLAAPVDRRIVAFGQLESVWPVAGTVLVQDGTAYAAAGRAPDADGGVTVVALDPTTGQHKWTTAISRDMTGMCDYLIGDGARLFLADRQLDPATASAWPTRRLWASCLTPAKPSIWVSSVSSFLWQSQNPWPS
jgi:outer membrane protein assembly factor BamB